MRAMAASCGFTKTQVTRSRLRTASAAVRREEDGAHGHMTDEDVPRATHTVSFSQVRGHVGRQKREMTSSAPLPAGSACPMHQVWLKE